MSRPKGSRNKKYSVPEKLDQEAASETDIAEASEAVEEKFNNFPPAHDPDREKNILRDYTVNKKSRRPESDEENEDPEDLPFYLQNLPAGSDKRKHIVAAAQAALILGTPPAQVSAQFGIAPARVAEWKDTLITVGAIGRRDRLSEMLMAYIEQEMKTLMSISIVTSRDEWVERQDADQLAHFVAVKSDRLLMLLQAFGRVEASRQQYAQQLQVVDQHG